MSQHESNDGHEKSEKIVILCGSCGQKLRVPALKKKILVICPICKHQFDCYAERDKLIEELLQEIGGYQTLYCLSKKQFFQSWQGHASAWYAKESKGTDVVIKVYDTMLWFWADLGGIGSWVKVDIRPDLVDYCQRIEARFGLQTSSNLAPWLKYHQDDTRRLLVLIRPYYPCSLVAYLSSKKISNDQQGFGEEILPLLPTIAADIDNLANNGVFANVSANNLFVREEKTILTDWGTSYISDLIRQHDCETKSISQDNNAEDFVPIVDKLGKRPIFIDPHFSTSSCLRFARTYFYLRTGHYANYDSDLERLANLEERAIVMGALSQINAFPSCSAFVEALEGLNISK
jgi:hypothetical protein